MYIHTHLTLVIKINMLKFSVEIKILCEPSIFVKNLNTYMNK